MKHLTPCFLMILLASFSGLTRANPIVKILHPSGHIVVPDSSKVLEADRGLRAHTNHLLFVLDKPDTTTIAGETPQSIRSVYSLPSTGGGGVIAIVDAFNYPTALNDFNVFSSQFGLPIETSTVASAGSNKVFQVVFASGKQPGGDGSWNQEEALDIEWSHAMAPGAKIILVEAKSQSLTDLDAAVQFATTLPGVREISMSWGSSEYPTEVQNDSFLSKLGVILIASAGDKGGKVSYPSCSPNIISAGGTSINRDANGNFINETTWTSGGGGPSVYEPIPSYQAFLGSTIGKFRGTPDISFDANPNTGVAVYDSTGYLGSKGWLVFGGTSVSSPSLAGIINTANSGSFGAPAELGLIYSHYLNPSDFTDITSGTAGSFHATVGWDFCTGVGSDVGLSGK